MLFDYLFGRGKLDILGCFSQTSDLLVSTKRLRNGTSKNHQESTVHLVQLPHPQDQEHTDRYMLASSHA